MALTSGLRLGTYEVIAPLGSGPTAFPGAETAVPPTVDTVSGAAAAIYFDVARLASGTRPDLSLRRVADRTFSRPRALPALYASLGALQAFDVYSTRQAIARGAQ